MVEWLVHDMRKCPLECVDLAVYFEFDFIGCRLREKGVCNEYETSLPILNFQICCEVETRMTERNSALEGIEGVDEHIN